MSGVNGCHWYNPCSWFNCFFEDQTGAREPLTRDALDHPINHTDAPKTPDSQRRGISTPGNTPTKSPTVKADKMVTGQTWE